MDEKKAGREGFGVERKGNKECWWVRRREIPLFPFKNKFGRRGGRIRGCLCGHGLRANAPIKKIILAHIRDE